MSEYNVVFREVLTKYSAINNKILELNKKEVGADEITIAVASFFDPDSKKDGDHISTYYGTYRNFGNLRDFYYRNPLLASILVIQNPKLIETISSEPNFAKEFAKSVADIIYNSDESNKANVIESIKEMLFNLDLDSNLAKALLEEEKIKSVIPTLLDDVLVIKRSYMENLGARSYRNILKHVKNGDSKEIIELLSLDVNFLKYVTQKDIKKHPELIGVFKNICYASSYSNLSQETKNYLNQNKGLANKLFNYLAYQKSDILVALSDEFKSLSPSICYALENKKKYEAMEQVVKNFREIDLDRFQIGKQVDLMLKSEINRRLKNNEIKIDSETFVNTERIRDCVNDFFNQNSGLEGNINIIKGLRDLPDNVKNLIDKIISVESDNILKLKQINYLVGVHNEKKSYSEFIKEIVYDAVENSSIDKILPVVKNFDKNNKTVAITNLMYRAIDEKEKGIDDKNNKPLKIYKALKEELKDDKECQNIFDDLSAIDPLKDVKVLSNVLHEAKNKNKDIKKDTKVFDVLKKARTPKINNINNKDQIGG